MDKGIRFSIVIILYNQMQYIAECIQSVLNQSYPAYELIIVDDGSTDGGGIYVRHEAEKYPDFIKVITQENSGAFAARATGMKHVTGDYFIVIDSDDTLRQDALKIVADRLEKTKTDIVLINYSKNSSFFPSWCDYKNNGIVADADGRVDKRAYLVTLATSNVVNQMAFKFYKAELIAKTDVEKYGAGVRMGEDRIHTLMFADVAQSVLLVDEPLYYYRVNANSATQKYNPHCIESSVKCCRISRMFVDKWFVKEEANIYSNQFDWIVMRQRYKEPFWRCYRWSRVKSALDILLSNEYGYAILQREASRENPQANKKLLNAFLKRNYRFLFLYFEGIKFLRLSARLVPAPLKQTIIWKMHNSKS